MFNFVKNINGPNFPAVELMPTTASTTYTIGEALRMGAGGLICATGTTMASHIALKSYVAPATGMEKLPCHVIAENTEFKVDVDSGSYAAIVPGDKLTLGSGGLTVTATTTNGVFTVVENNTTNIVGRFVK